MQPTEKEREQMRNTFIYNAAMLGLMVEYLTCVLLNFLPWERSRMLAVVEEMKELKEKPETLLFSGRTIKDK